jgi:hypothetical protein
MVESRRYQTNKFKPAYIKDKRAPDLRKPIRRQIGERIGGEFTAAERAMLNLQFEMADQIDMLNRRLEWMASSALQTGRVTIAGEGFPTTVVDFGRDPALTVALTGTDAWPLNVPAGAKTQFRVIASKNGKRLFYKNRVLFVLILFSLTNHGRHSKKIPRWKIARSFFQLKTHPGTSLTQALRLCLAPSIKEPGATITFGFITTGLLMT